MLVHDPDLGEADPGGLGMYLKKLIGVTIDFFPEKEAKIGFPFATI